MRGADAGALLEVVEAVETDAERVQIARLGGLEPGYAITLGDDAFEVRLGSQETVEFPYNPSALGAMAFSWRRLTHKWSVASRPNIFKRA